MSALAMALLLFGDFWGKVAQTPYDALLGEGTRLRSQAERSCLPPISCREGSPAFLAQQALLRQAATAFQHAAALRPEDPDAPFFAAGSLREAHDYEAAAAQYEESRRRRAEGPRELDICFDLGTTWANLGRFQRSIDEYMRALRLTHEPHDRAGLLINAAESTMALGRLRESIDLYRRGVETSEQALHAGTLGADEQAVHLLGLAVALDRDEQVEKAAQTVARALELDAGAQRLHGHSNFFVPEGDVSYYDALVALAKGDRATATLAFQRFLRDVPQSPFASRARAHLAELGAQAPPVHLAPAHISRAGILVASGGMSAPELDATMKTHLDDIAHCVHAPDGPFRVIVDVSARGKVTSISIPDGGFDRCLRDAARRWQFRRTEAPTRFVMRIVVER